MKALITGSNGFVGKHLIKELESNGYTTYGIDIAGCEGSFCVDILDADTLKKCVADYKPDFVFHLAAQADVGASWKIPQKTYNINVIGTINLLEAVKNAQSKARLLLIGTSNQYAAKGYLDKPISEETTLVAENPYAASKKAQEEIAEIYIKAYEMDIVSTRSFNHSGPGQGLGYLIPDLCNGIVKVERGEAEFLKVGNMEAIRDFSDVRDIVRAYRLLAEMGETGEAYNVGAGVGSKAQEILDMLVSLANEKIEVKQDESKMRKSDTPILVCDNSKLRSVTGWEREISLEKTLSDTLDYYRKKAS